jgi:hypothetical protein
MDPYWFQCGSGFREPNQCRSVQIRIPIRILSHKNFRIRILITDKDPGQPNECGSGSTTLSKRQKLWLWRNLKYLNGHLSDSGSLLAHSDVNAVELLLGVVTLVEPENADNQISSFLIQDIRTRTRSSHRTKMYNL